MLYVKVASMIADKAAKLAVDKMFEHQGGLKATMLSAWRRLVDGKTVVVLTGVGGTGKTTLQQIISGEKSLEELSPDYVVSLDNEVRRRKGNFFHTIYTQPGQAKNAEFTVDEIKLALQGASRILYIPVVSYGHNALFDITLNDIRERVGGENLDEISANYLAQERASEVERVSSFGDILASLPNEVKIDILTVVTKLDLWWPMRRQVNDHYQGGDYQKAIQGIIDRRQRHNTRENKVSVCLIPANVVTVDGYALAATAKGFDIRTQRAQFANFVNVTTRFLEI